MNATTRTFSLQSAEWNVVLSTPVALKEAMTRPIVTPSFVLSEDALALCEADPPVVNATEFLPIDGFCLLAAADALLSSSDSDEASRARAFAVGGPASDFFPPSTGAEWGSLLLSLSVVDGLFASCVVPVSAPGAAA